MNQQEFDQAMQGTFARFVPFQGTGPYYKLTGISAEWKAPNPQILVTVFDSRGMPKTNVTVHNSYPGGGEALQARFPFREFNLGAGAKTQHGEPGPHTILIAPGNGDVVEGLGIPDLGRNGYVLFHLFYQLTDSSQPPPAPGTGITRAEAISSFDAIIATLTDVRDDLIHSA